MASPSREREFLVALLRALADPERASRLPPENDTLLAVARHHRLTALLSVIAGDRLPPALAEACRRDRLAVVARSLLLEQVAEECARALVEAGIEVAILKGLDYARRLYLSPGVRPTADVDVLVPDGDRRAAFQVLDRLGFEPRAAAPGFDDPDYHEVTWTRDGVEVDLHLALAPLARCRIDYRAVWAEAGLTSLGGVRVRLLARTHAAIFHSLHMAIDHFDVPAIYLLDLTRLIPGGAELQAARSLARSWRCRRPLETAIALCAAFLPDWPGAATGPRRVGQQTIVAHYGSTAPLPRWRQLVRKVEHFDSPTDAVRYLVVQSRRNLREKIERRTRRRSARERLDLPPGPRGDRGRTADGGGAARDLAKFPSPK